MIDSIRPIVRTAIRWLAFGLVLAAGPVVLRAADDPIQVSVLEIGESRLSTAIRPNYVLRFQWPVAVRIEVESEGGFTGRLETVLRSTDNPAWRPVNVREAAWLDVELDLAAHQRETFDLHYTPMVLLGEYRGIAWRVRDSEGLVVASGDRRTSRSDPDDEALQWALYVTPSTGEGRRRAPEDAFRVAFRYAPYRTVVIESRDLVGLANAQQQALLDATAFGRTLIVCGDSAGLAGPIRDALALEDSVIWRGDGGAELREVPLVLGIVRQYTGTIDELIGSHETVRKLVDLGSSVKPRQVEYSTFPVELWRYLLSLEDEAESIRTIQVVWLSILGAALIAVGVVWLAARKHPPLPWLGLVALTVVVCISAPVGYQLLVANPIGNVSQDAATVWHDSYGTTQIRQVFSQRGGGGGTTPAGVRYRRGSNALWFPMSSGSRWLTVVETFNEGRIESMGISSAQHQRLGLLGLYGEAVDPAWVGGAAWVDGRLAGRLRAGHDFESAVLVGYGGTAALGAVRAGQELDLSRVEFRLGHDHLRPADLSLIADNWLARTWMRPFNSTLSWVHRLRTLTETELYIVARDASPRHLVHVQPIRLTLVAHAPRHRLTTLVPSTDLGTKYRLFVPEKIFDAWQVGTVVGPASTSFTIDEELPTYRWNGFRVIEVEPSYRTAGGHDNPYFELRWNGGTSS